MSTPATGPAVSVTSGPDRVVIDGDPEEVARALESLAAVVRYVAEPGTLIHASVELSLPAKAMPCPHCGLPLLDLVRLGSMPPCLVCGYRGDL